jgi:hypothetical protein
VPSARRLSQTLGHASNLTWERVCCALYRLRPRARRNFQRAHHHRSVPPRSPSSSVIVGREVVRPSRSALVGVGSKASKEGSHLAPLPPGHKAKIQVGLAQSRPSSSDPTHSWALSRGGLASSRSINLQVQLKHRSFGLCLQRWYASASKCKHKHNARRLSERGLTLPSSGRAFGTPLKSNVRPHKLCFRISSPPMKTASRY